MPQITQPRRIVGREEKFLYPETAGSPLRQPRVTLPARAQNQVRALQFDSSVYDGQGSQTRRPGRCEKIVRFFLAVPTRRALLFAFKVR
jgi:hypothetical protein